MVVSNSIPSSTKDCVPCNSQIVSYCYITAICPILAAGQQTAGSPQRLRSTHYRNTKEQVCYKLLQVNMLMQSEKQQGQQGSVGVSTTSGSVKVLCFCPTEWSQRVLYDLYGLRKSNVCYVFLVHRLQLLNLNNNIVFESTKARENTE